MLAHRVSWVLANGAIPDGLCVLHKCDNPPCLNPDHLFLGTRAENAADRGRKGRTRVGQGERHYNAKLTEEKVREIRSLAAAGHGIRELGRRFGISHMSISFVVRRKGWKHVP